MSFFDVYFYIASLIFGRLAASASDDATRSCMLSFSGDFLGKVCERVRVCMCMLFLWSERDGCARRGEIF